MDISNLLLGAAAFLLIYLVALYNGLVKLNHRVRNAFAQIDVQLKRRRDLIPKLVEAVKVYMTHERETLTLLTEARARAVAAGDAGAGAPLPVGLGTLMGAEALLGSALHQLLAIVENYPELKADTNLLQLQEELSSTENRIAFARQAYNDAAMSYNNRREAFPDLLIARLFAFEESPYWELDEAGAAAPPPLGFGG